MKKRKAVGKSLDSDMKITPTTLTQCGGAQRAGWTCEQTHTRTSHTIYTCIHPQPCIHYQLSLSYHSPVHHMERPPIRPNLQHPTGTWC